MTSPNRTPAAASSRSQCDDVAPKEDFQQALTALIPHLRAFAKSLCRDPAWADDLTQDALASAWKARNSYQPGTNLKAWVYRILRNKFYTDHRRAWRTSLLEPEIAESTLVARDNVECILELDEVRRALTELTDEHREALLLVGVGGFSYEEAAEVLQVPLGTVKSRVSRSRTCLLARLEAGGNGHDGQPASRAFDAIVEQLPGREGGFPGSSAPPVMA